jgi:hypothetical protein
VKSQILKEEEINQIRARRKECEQNTPRGGRMSILRWTQTTSSAVTGTDAEAFTLSHLLLPTPQAHTVPYCAITYLPYGRHGGPWEESLCTAHSAAHSL